jgi:uroporphyrinogen-III synthase
LFDSQSFVWITRPEKQGHQTAAVYQHYGFQTLVAPILSVKYFSLCKSELDGFDVIITTSANAIEAVAHMENLKNKKLFCVGAASYKTAIDHGFTNIVQSNGTSNVEGLLKTVLKGGLEKHRKILYLRGQNISCDLRAMLKLQDLNIEEKIAYETQSTELDSCVHEYISKGKIKAVTVFSLKTAMLVKNFFVTHNLVNYTAEITALCLSNEIASTIQDIPWKGIQIAQKAENLALLLQGR